MRFYTNTSKALLISLLLTIILWHSLCSTSPIQAAENTPPRVIIFLIEGLRLSDLDPQITPCLWKLAEQGAAGLLIPQLGEDRNTWDALCTISAGQTAVSSPDALLNFMTGENIGGENAGSLFIRQTGIDPASAGIVVCSLATIMGNNREHGQANPGKLGDRLHQLGYQTIVIGNSDRPGHYRRLGPLILMDHRGLVDNGVVDRTMLNPDTPLLLPYQSNYAAMLKEACNFKENKCVILLELGDLSRLDSMSKYFTTGQYTRERHSLLSQMDSFADRILDSQASYSPGVYVLNPAPAYNPQKAEALFAPLIISKTGLHGTLSALSTRREGFVPLTSLQDSIINCLDPGQSESLFSQPQVNTAAFLRQSNQAAVFRYINQTLIMTITVFTMLLALVAALILIIRKRKNSLVFLLLSFALALPVSLLLISIWSFNSPWLFIVFLVLVTLGTALISTCLGQALDINPLVPMLFATIALVVGDTGTGAHLMGGSLLSYQITGGVRYYGLGNEYMGVLIGSTISLATLLFPKQPSIFSKIALSGLFAGVAAFIGAPFLGVNVGGAITALVGFSYTFLILNHKRIGLTSILSMVLGTFLFLSIMAFLDLRQPAQLQSHLGHTIMAIVQGGPASIMPVIARKLNLALQYINYTIWGWIFLLGIIAAASLFFRPGAWLQKHFQAQTHILMGLKGLLLSMIVAILFNDSGLTAAAALAVYFVVLLFFSKVSAKPHSNRNGV
ncbi:MAG TPA: hypothetical protein VN426_16665 [Syntrophomonadaceae bacterium]|nr:hypothetical protein [Syntrophomonadaceae bacterium]